MSTNNPITRPNDPANPAAEGPNGFKGLTKREHFAALALQGLINATWCPTQEVAKTAVEQADALINALNSTPVSYTNEK